MGCGSSTPESSTASLSREKENVKSNSEDHAKANGHSQNSVQNKDTARQNGVHREKSKDSPKKEIAVPKPVAFDVDVNANSAAKAPPKRLKQQLEPITDAPKLTAEMLEEKLKAADEKRAQTLELVRETSRRSTRLRSRILDAQKFEQQRQTEISDEITEKQKLADLKKEQKRKEMEEKSRAREERARRVRQKAKEMRGEADLEFELEKDENFNDDEGLETEDSWLTEETPSRGDSGVGERIYSGRESPAKKLRPITSAEQRARMINSASTSDSFDYAFQRDPKKNNKAVNDDDDDFFG